MPGRGRRKGSRRAERERSVLSPLPMGSQIDGGLTEQWEATA